LFIDKILVVYQAVGRVAILYHPLIEYSSGNLRSPPPMFFQESAKLPAGVFGSVIYGNVTVADQVTGGGVPYVAIKALN